MNQGKLDQEDNIVFVIMIVMATLNSIIGIIIFRLGIFHIEITIKGITTFEYLTREKNNNKVGAKEEVNDRKINESSKKSIMRENVHDESPVKLPSIKEVSISRREASSIEEEKKQVDIEEERQEIERRNLSLIMQKSRKSLKAGSRFMKYSQSEAILEKGSKKKKSTKVIINSPEKRKLVYFSEKYRVKRKKDMMQQTSLVIKDSRRDKEEDMIGRGRDKRKTNSMDDFNDNMENRFREVNASQGSKTFKKRHSDSEFEEI